MAAALLHLENLLIDSAFQILSTTVIVSFCDIFLARRVSGKSFYLLFGLTTLGNAVLLNLLNAHMGTMGNILIPLVTALPLIFGGYSCTIWQAVFYDAASYAFLCMMDYATQLAFSAVSGDSLAALRTETIGYVFTGLSARSIEIVSTYMMAKLHKGSGNKTANLPWIYWFSMLSVPTLVFAFYRFFLRADAENPLSNAFVGWIGSSLVFVQMLLLWQTIRIQTEKQKQAEILALQKETELRLESTAQLSAAYEAQRKATHDYTNHLAVLQELLHDGKAAEAQHYLNELTQAPSAAPVVYTGTAVLDAVLNQKYAQAKAAGVCIRFQIADIPGLSVPQKDFVTVLANLLDNAIEAARQAENDKSIVFKLLPVSSCKAILCVRNTAMPVQITNGQIPTSKENPLLHGYGLQNIGSILEQNHCPYTFEYRDGWFIFAAELPCNAGESELS